MTLPGVESTSMDDMWFMDRPLISTTSSELRLAESEVVEDEDELLDEERFLLTPAEEDEEPLDESLAL